MLDDVYAEVRRLIVVLQDEQAPDAAEELDRAMYGSTSGEILSDLGAGLSAILRKRRELTAPLRDRLTALLHEVDGLLRAVGHITPTDWREQAPDEEHR